MSKKKQREMRGRTRIDLHSDVRDASADTDLLHRKHFVTAAWALAIAILSGIGGALYQKVQGPTQVTIMNPDTATRVVLATDSTQRRLMARIVDEIRNLRIDQRSRGPTEPSSGNALADPPSAVPVTGPSGRITPNAVQLPEFVVAGAKGYVSRDLGVFARTSCAGGEYAPASDVAVELVFRNAADTGRFSPIVVQVTRRSSPTGGVRVFEQQYQLRTRSLLVFPAPPDLGTYDLEVGVYLRENQGQQYPPLYVHQCRLTVAPPTVDIRVNGLKGPITLEGEAPYTYSWASTRARSCQMTSPVSSGISTSGTSGQIGLGNPFYPKRGESVSISVICESGMATGSDAVIVKR